MSLPLSSVRRAVVRFSWILLFALPSTVFSQTNYYGANGTEYPIVGQLLGDQVWPDIAVGPNGGFVVWQDNATDGSGWGISARRLDSTLSGTLSTFRVNVVGTNDQENARVALLKNGGATFVWQGGIEGVNQHIYARFLSPANTWLTTNDVLISRVVTNIYILRATNITTTITTNITRSGTSYTTNTTQTITSVTNISAQSYSINPSIAVLNNSNVVVVWSSYNEAAAGSMQDVYAQILSPTGQKIGTNFLVNQFIPYNQRTPTVTALKNGGFAVAWISEQEQTSVNESSIDQTNGLSSSQIDLPSSDVYARLFNSNGVPVSAEFLVNSNSFPCANPALASGSDGGFMVTWCAHNMVDSSSSLDVYARSYSSAGVGGNVVVVNSTLYGDQYAPRISSIGTDYFVVWTSLGQDGSREGVYGKFIHADGTPISGEFRVNTTTIGQQMQPAVASDGSQQFIAVWTSYTGSQYGFDLYAQRYLNAASLLASMSAPFVNAPFTLSNGVYQPQLAVSWPPVLGISVSNYEVYVDGNSSPMAVMANNSWTMTAANGLTASSAHSFAVDYVTTDGRRSPLSPSTSGTTWSGLNWGGIPYEWMTNYFGTDMSKWPSASAPVVAGGPTLLDIFQTGSNPLDSNTWLVQTLIQTSQGMFLTWNTQPGLTYQVQIKTNLTSAWNNFGPPRFAAGTSDSVYVGGNPASYFRIQLQR